MAWQFWLCLLSHLEETLGLWQQKCSLQCSESPARGQQALLQPMAEPHSQALTPCHSETGVYPSHLGNGSTYTHTHPSLEALGLAQ